MTDVTLGVKVDVDTLRGYLEGVPALLDLFRKRGIRASFFFSMGPDNSGKAIRRIFRRGFLAKMLRTKAPSTYGLKTLLYGTLLPAPQIVPANPDILRRAVDEGHDCGVHCWDHVKWQDCLPRLPEDEIRRDFAKAMDLFESVTGRRAKACAAPGWQTTPTSFSVQDEFGLDYASDVRKGRHPFYPKASGRSFKTLQLPTTLPTLDEAYGSMPEADLPEFFAGQVQPGFNLITIHAEMEGLGQRTLFERILDAFAGKNAVFSALDRIASRCGKSLVPVCGVAIGRIEGRAGTLTIQTTACEEEQR